MTANTAQLISMCDLVHAQKILINTGQGSVLRFSYRHDVNGDGHEIVGSKKRLHYEDADDTLGELTTLSCASILFY